MQKKGYNQKTLILGIRPEDIHDEPIVLQSSPDSTVEINIEVAELLGAETMIHGKLSSQNFVARINARSEIKATDRLSLAFSLTKAHFFDIDTEQRIRNE